MKTKFFSRTRVASPPIGPSPDGGTWVGFAREGAGFVESFGQSLFNLTFSTDVPTRLVVGGQTTTTGDAGSEMSTTRRPVGGVAGDAE